MQPTHLDPNGAVTVGVHICHRAVGHRGKGYPRPVTEPAPRRGIQPATDAEYRERLHSPWWWYPIGVLVGLLLGAEFDVVMPQALVGLPVLVGILLAVAVIWRISSGTVRVADGRVLAGDHSVPVTEIEQSYLLNPAELRRLVGRHGDPLAFTFIRSFIGPGVQLVLSRPATAEDEPTRLREPYWVLSSRHPDRFLDAVAASRSQLG
jgi:Protein of unknown function (DUF3093)